MEFLIAALHEAAEHRMLVTMLLMAAATSLVVLIEPRAAWLLLLAALALLAVASLLFGHRIVGALMAKYGATGVEAGVGVDELRSRCNEPTQALAASRRGQRFSRVWTDKRRTHADTQAAFAAAGCSDQAVSTGHDSARHGRGSSRQVEMAR